MDRRVAKVIELMRATVGQPLPISEFAQSANLSESRLRHLFKADTGRSFVQYYRTLRMERAKELAETTFLSVKEIMTNVGVRDESHFVRDFHKVYGLSPRQYRLAVCSGLRPGEAVSDQPAKSANK